jgi:ABC transporter with metal-binding/Fe-S-binding domain ATP-binding protein
MKALCLISGGKDSWYACQLARHMGLEISSVVNFVPASEASYMLHAINARFVRTQAKAAGIKYHVFHVSGLKEKEVDEMKRHLMDVVKKEDVEMVISGAVKSDYQKHRIDMICEELGIISYAPLWHKDEVMLLREVVSAGIKFVIVRVAAEGIESWIGKEISEKNVDDFIFSLKKAKSNVVGEGGEYETFVISLPLFKYDLGIKEHKIIDDEGAKNLVINAIELKAKNRKR